MFWLRLIIKTVNALHFFPLNSCLYTDFFIGLLIIFHWFVWAVHLLRKLAVGVIFLFFLKMIWYLYILWNGDIIFSLQMSLNLAHQELSFCFVIPHTYSFLHIIYRSILVSFRIMLNLVKISNFWMYCGSNRHIQYQMIKLKERNRFVSLSILNV